jgi:alkyldihydroxyacetonephosphate synthase
MKGKKMGHNNSQLRQKLSKIVGEENISDSDIDKYCYSGQILPRYRAVGEFGPGMYPEFIVWPETTEQVTQLVRIANEEEIPVIPWGGGIGARGGSMPVSEHTVIIDTKKMNKIREINEYAMMVTVDAGVFVEDMNMELEKRGYWFPHEPPSFCASTVGGFLGAAAAGWWVPKYGYMGDLLLCLEVVMPNGEVLKTKPVMKHSVGPNLNWLFVGSGGILGIITNATLQFFPIPEARRIHIITFDDFDTAFKAAYEITKQGAHPFVARVGDEDHSKNYLGPELEYRELEGSTIVVGFDGNKDVVKAEEKLALGIISEMGGKDLGTELGKTFWRTRFDYFRGRKNIEFAGDVVTSCTTFDKALGLYHEIHDLYKKYGVNVSTHIPHFNSKGVSIYFIYAYPVSPEGIVLCEKVRSEAFDIIKKYDATIEHHHEVGRTLGKYIKGELGYGLEVLRAIKKSLDPNKIMNPGKIGLEEKVNER